MIMHIEREDSGRDGNPVQYIPWVSGNGVLRLQRDLQCRSLMCLYISYPASRRAEISNMIIHHVYIEVVAIRSSTKSHLPLWLAEMTSQVQL